MFRNAMIFTIPPGLIAGICEANEIGLDEALAALEVRDPLSVERMNVGFSKPHGKHGEDFAHDVDDRTWITIAQRERLLPAAVLRAEMQKKLEQIEAAEGRRPGGRERKRIMEDLTAELLPRAFIQPRRTDAYIDHARGLVVVDTSSRSVGDAVISLLRNALGTFPALPLNAEADPRAVLTGWLSDTALPANMVLGENAVLIDEPPAGVTLRKQDLHGDEVEALLEGGKRAARIEVIYDQRIAASMADDLVLRKITLLDWFSDRMAEREDETVAGELDARFFLFSTEFGRLFDMLKAAFRFSTQEPDPTQQQLPGPDAGDAARAAWERLKRMGGEDGISRVTISMGDRVLLDSADPTKGGDPPDELYAAAVAEVRSSGKASISRVQRVLKIGYNRAARLVEAMEAAGVVSAPKANGDREVIPA